MIMTGEINRSLMRNIIVSIFVTNFNGPVTVDSGENFTILSLLDEVNIRLGWYATASTTEADLQEELFKMISERILEKILDDNYVITEKGIDWYNDAE